MTTLADVRSDVGALLASAVDSLTWATGLLDAAIRLGLAEVDGCLIYESDVTVTTADYEQDLSSIPDLLAVLALAYPWTAGADFARRLIAWRVVGAGRVYFDRIEAQVGEVIRVRHTKHHTLTDLDDAATTTLPTSYQPLLALAAAAWACDLRLRQLSENPATPKGATDVLAKVAAAYRGEVAHRLARSPAQPGPVWSGLGL